MSYENDIDALFATYTSLLPMQKEDEDRLWQKFRLDWNYNSNRIEGNTLTYGETEALLILGTEPKRLQRDIREMKAHDLGIKYLRGLVDSRRYITEANIRELNQITLKQNYWIETETADGNISRKEIIPGTYKKTPNHVRLRGGGIHKFAEPQDVATRMESTVKSIRAYLKKPDANLAKFLAVLHHDFINTHPFDDGNGRVCRMLLNYVCLKLGWPPVIIKDKNKDDYLLALEQSDDGNLSALETLMKSELEWSLNKSIAAARGEDIEDADDIDKEIDLAVRENTPPYSGISSVTNIKKAYLLLVVPTLDRLDELLSRFRPLFFNYTTNDNMNGIEKLKCDLSEDRVPESSRLLWMCQLSAFKESTHRADIKTEVSITFDKTGCQIRIATGFHQGFKNLRTVKFHCEYSELETQCEALQNKCYSTIGRTTLDLTDTYKKLSGKTIQDLADELFSSFGDDENNKAQIEIIYRDN